MSGLTGGRYSYWIYIYSSSGTFTNSSATVELYTGASGNGVLKLFNVPQDGGAGRWWHVFDVVVTADSQCQSVTVEYFDAVQFNSTTATAVTGSTFIGRTCVGNSSICNTQVTGAWKTCGYGQSFAFATLTRNL